MLKSNRQYRFGKSVNSFYFKNSRELLGFFCCFVLLSEPWVESQNSGGKGTLGGMWFPLPLKVRSAVRSDLVVQGLIQPGLLNLYGGRQHNLFKQTVPLLDCPQGENYLFVASLNVSLFQPVSSCSPIPHLCKKTGSTFWLPPQRCCWVPPGRAFPRLKKP